MSNILAPVVPFLSGVLILMLAKKKPAFKKGWLLLAFICFIWATADALWFILKDFSAIDPSDFAPLNYLYTLSNILLLSAGLYYFITHLRQWHLPQLIADAVVSWLVVVTMLTDSILMHINFATWTMHEILITSIYVITNATAFVLLLTLVSSTRVNKISHSFKFILAGYLLFIITDLSYVYAHAFSVYRPNAFIDSLYILSMACFGIAAAISLSVPQASVAQPTFSKNPQNMGAPNRLLLFLIVPILMYAFGYLDFSILLMCVVIMIMYRFISGYIQASLKNELLLKEMTLLNEQLEAIVDKRTEALRKANHLLEQASYTDSLTQMNNRHSFVKQVDELISNKKIFSVFYMDFNHFKVINDLHGHEMGDRVLQEISRRFLRLKKKIENFFVWAATNLQ